MLRLFRSKVKSNPGQRTESVSCLGTDEICSLLTMPRISTAGTTGMKILSDPHNPDLDIIFVHGLTDNRETTWTHTNDTFWPRDLLAQDFPKARIMTYGYDIDRFRNSTATSDPLYEQGLSLGYSIVSQRIDCSSRPIVFIAHGLGGLICQQTLILSNTIDGLWQISSRSVGIVFMGTPHYGYSLASYREKLSKCMEKVSSINSSRSLETLHTDWDDIPRVRNEFQLMLHRGDLSVRIFCFYEALPINDIVGKMVDDQSAVLRGHENTSIDADHLTMAKFGGHEDRSYASVRSIITKWIQEPVSDSSGSHSLLFEMDSNPCPSWLLPLHSEPFTGSISGGSGTEYNALSTCFYL